MEKDFVLYFGRIVFYLIFSNTRYKVGAIANQNASSCLKKAIITTDTHKVNATFEMFDNRQTFSCRSPETSFVYLCNVTYVTITANKFLTSDVECRL